MITVVNKRHYRDEGVYIGRPSLLGNPFKIGEHGTREEVIDKYAVWLRRQIQNRNAVYRELLRLAELARKGDLILICWCKEPNREIDCHGDAVKSEISRLNSI